MGVAIPCDAAELGGCGHQAKVRQRGQNCSCERPIRFCAGVTRIRFGWAELMNS